MTQEYAELVRRARQGVQKRVIATEDDELRKISKVTPGGEITSIVCGTLIVNPLGIAIVPFLHA